MREYKNQIDHKLIEEVLGEFTQDYKDLAKKRYELNELIKDKEIALAKKLEYKTIGKISELKLNYSAWRDNFYITYVSNTQYNAWWKFW